MNDLFKLFKEIFWQALLAEVWHFVGMPEVGKHILDTFKQVVKCKK